MYEKRYCVYTSILLGIITIIFTLNSFAGSGKLGKLPEFRNISADTTETDSTGIIAAVGNGSGFGEALFSETLTLKPHIEDIYSIYIGFFGITFDQDTGEVHQTRYTDNHFNVDGEITSSYPMGYLMMNGDFRVGFGTMTDTTYVMVDTVNVPVVKEIVHNSYIRPESSDRFIILEYTIFNQDTGVTLTGGNALFLCDIDVGNSAYDNLTGFDTENRAVFQYSEGDDYAGFALIFPQLQPEYGNYDNWYFYGSDAEVDSIAAAPSYDNSLDSIPGDYSTYLVFNIGNIPPGGSLTAALAFAIDENIDDLKDQFFLAEELYNLYLNEITPPPIPLSPGLISVYPNPFNSSITIAFDLNNDANGWIKIYNSIGRVVYTLQSGGFKTGSHNYKWNGLNSDGQSVSAGVYFIQTNFPGINETRKIIFLP